jgi:hypothetical protein
MVILVINNTSLNLQATHLKTLKMHSVEKKKKVVSWTNKHRPNSEVQLPTLDHRELIVISPLSLSKDLKLVAAAVRSA